MDTGDAGNEWARDAMYVRVWLGPTAVAHYRADLDLARQYVGVMQRHFRGLRYTIDPLPAHAPPVRELPAWQLEVAAP